MNNLYHLLPLVSGVILAIQLVVEAKNYNRFSVHPIAFMAFSTAALATLAWAWLAKKNPFPTLQQFSSVDWYLHFGGIARVCYLAFIITAIPKVGPGTTFSTAMAAQVITALVISQFGWFDMPLQKMNTPQIIGTILLIIGIFLVIGKK